LITTSFFIDNYIFIQWIKEDYSFSGFDKRNNNLVYIFQFQIYPPFASVKSPFIAEIIDSFEANDYFYIVTHESKGMNFNQFNENSSQIPQQQIIKMLVQICEGINEFHEHDLVYNRIHPSNIIILSSSKLFLHFFEQKSKYPTSSASKESNIFQLSCLFSEYAHIDSLSNLISQMKQPNPTISCFSILKYLKSFLLDHTFDLSSFHLSSFTTLYSNQRRSFKHGEFPSFALKIVSSENMENELIDQAQFSFVSTPNHPMKYPRHDFNSFNQTNLILSMRIFNEVRKKGNREVMYSLALLCKLPERRIPFHFFDSNWSSGSNPLLLIFQKSASKGSLDALFCLGIFEETFVSKRRQILNYLIENNYSFAMFEKGINLLASSRNFEETYSLLLKGAENGSFGLSHHLSLFFTLIPISQFLERSNYF
jgi:hypothetical protein